MEVNNDNILSVEKFKSWESTIEDLFAVFSCCWLVCVLSASKLSRCWCKLCVWRGVYGRLSLSLTARGGCTNGEKMLRASKGHYFFTFSFFFELAFQKCDFLQYVMQWGVNFSI